eukprot:6214773-Pleurochrysis_carterae.AAC.5
MLPCCISSHFVRPFARYTLFYLARADPLREDEIECEIMLAVSTEKTVTEAEAEVRERSMRPTIALQRDVSATHRNGEHSLSSRFTFEQTRSSACT